METRIDALLGPIVREAGKSLPDAVGEVREAVDFLRYHAAGVRGWDSAAHKPLGAVACISPWNFPLAIFTGQVAAALAAGNVVLAKPAEETPLVASLAVGLLHEAGVPQDVLQLLPGDGAIGGRLVADGRIRGVMFTGSTEVARLINRALAGRLNPDGRPVPLVAETGGLNAMIVDSSALPEQVVADVLTSAFDSAGQRCSALRLLCVQEDVAERVLTMLRGAMAELSVGSPDRLSTDVGPVISAEARDGILGHVATMRARGHAVHAIPLPEACRHGTFVAPTLIEVARVADVEREVFGPVLHVLRFRRGEVEALLRKINATGYGLTFGVHSRMDGTVARAVAGISAGNAYVNRNLIGAVVGVQPFGGHGLSGTGPKAGGPLYLRRLLAAAPAAPELPAVPPQPGPTALTEWLRATGRNAMAEHCAQQAAASRVGVDLLLPGPVGEENRYTLRPRGNVLCQAVTAEGLVLQLAACLSTGNAAHIRAPTTATVALAGLPPAVARRVVKASEDGEADCDAVLFEGRAGELQQALAVVAASDGPIRPVLAATPAEVSAGHLYPPDMLLTEHSISTNTAAAGGNATLMSL